MSKIDELQLEAMLLALNAEIDSRNLEEDKENFHLKEMLGQVLKNQSVIMRLLLNNKSLEEKIENIQFDDCQQRWVTG